MMKFEEVLKRMQEDITKVARRVHWTNITPYRYIWITLKNTVAVNVGDGFSAPPLFSVEDYLAEDWVLMEKEDE